MDLTITRRDEWGARYADGHGAADVPWTENWLHHSVTIAPDLLPPYDDEARAMRALEQIGQDRFGRGISYTVAVMPTGRAYEGHALHKEGAHTGGRNDTARALVLVGNYDQDEVTDAQVDTCARILVRWWRRGLCSHPYLNGGHQDAPGAATACPGRHGRAAVDRINDRAAELARAAIDQEDDVAISNEDAELIAAKVWARNLGATRGGGVELPDQSAKDRVNALHRLGALQKMHGAELRANLEALQPAELAELVPEQIVPEVVAELVRRLHNAPPPAPAESVPASFVAADAAAEQIVPEQIVPEPAPEPRDAWLHPAPYNLAG